jgi:hypothetical protein
MNSPNHTHDDVGVVVPCRNGADILGRQLDALPRPFILMSEARDLVNPGWIDALETGEVLTR